MQLRHDRDRAQGRQRQQVPWLRAVDLDHATSRHPNRGFVENEQAQCAVGDARSN